jgi:alpha-tubulin suppressor-like RCC1 family protein
LGKRVVDVAIGPRHVVVATEDNLLFGWGSNEHGQLGTAFSTLVKIPTLLCTLKGKTLSGSYNQQMFEMSSSSKNLRGNFFLASSVYDDSR